MNKDEIINRLQSIRVNVFNVKADGEIETHWNLDGEFVRWELLVELLDRLDKERYDNDRKESNKS